MSWIYFWNSKSNICMMWLVITVELPLSQNCEHERHMGCVDGFWWLRLKGDCCSLKLLFAQAARSLLTKTNIKVLLFNVKHNINKNILRSNLLFHVVLSSILCYVVFNKHTWSCLHILFFNWVRPCKLMWFIYRT